LRDGPRLFPLRFVIAIQIQHESVKLVLPKPVAEIVEAYVV
jgi:hypothetical protein